jgi:hypothetical protein
MVDVYISKAVRGDRARIGLIVVRLAAYMDMRKCLLCSAPERTRRMESQSKGSVLIKICIRRRRPREMMMDANSQIAPITMSRRPLWGRALTVTEQDNCK